MTMADEEAPKRIKTLPPPSQKFQKAHTALVEEFARLERRIFPKHESLSSSFSQEVKKRNQALLYILKNDALKKEGEDENLVEPAAVAGYLMYSWTSLAASVTKLAVRETCRRQGYGEALLLAAVQQLRMRKVQCVNLHVDPARTAAVTLYKKLGFSLETVVTSYYAPDRDAYRMVLDLTLSG